MAEKATYQGVELIRQTELEVRTIERERSGTSWTRNEKYDKDGYYVVRDLYNPEELYHPLPRERGLLRYRGRDVSLYDYEPVERQVAGSLSRYTHPQYLRAHNAVRKKIEKIIGRKLYNTYFYDRFYLSGQYLDKHIDRAGCEISVSIHISNNLPDNLKDWPFKIKTPDVYTDKKKSSILVPGDEHSVVLNPGDGVIYKGHERPHWRDAMPFPKKKWFRKDTTEYYYHQIFFHYVLQDGERAHCAWDRAQQ